MWLLSLPFSPTVEIMVAVGLFTTSASLILRLFARHKQRLLFGMDDYLAATAWFVFLGVNMASIYASIQDAALTQLADSIQEAASNQGVPFYELSGSPENLAKAKSIVTNRSDAVFSGILCNVIALGCGRLSAVFFYRRIFYTTKQDVFDTVTKILIGILLLWTVCFFLLTLLACGTYITLTATGGNGDFATTCIVQDTQNGLAISSFLLDSLVLVLPLPKIWALHTPRARKIAISSVFLIALISLTASGLRIGIVFEAESLVFIEPRYAENSYIINLSSYFYQLLETAACLTAINMPSVWYFSHHLRAQRLREIAGAVLFFSYTKLRGNTEKSNAKSLENESIEFSDSEAIPTSRAHLVSAV